MKKKIIGIVVVLSVLTVLIAACAQPAAPATETVTTTATKTVTAAAALEEEVFEWRWSTHTTTTSPAYYSVIAPMTEEIERVSGGRLKITSYPINAISPPADQLKSCASGMIEMVYSATAYSKGIMPELSALELPFATRDLKDAVVPYYYYGIKDFFTESYAGQGVHLVDFVNTATAPLISTKPIKRAADFNGMKIRTIGLIATFVEELGAASTYVPGGEVYAALAAGTFDAATWGSPATFVDLGWHEVAKYLIDPPILSANPRVDVFVNMDAWNALPPDLQAIVEECASYNCSAGFYMETVQADFEAKAALDEQGVTWCYIPEEDYPVLMEAAEAVWTTVANEGPRSKEAVKMMTDYLRLAGYTDFKVD